ncbi:F-box/kelch-repeat protein At3g06240-like [Durio zibethinus]|uniref:F-box/kelch-repeat protein At3g06240-like n=1 Tax=Durio zibethinus TaxID=66656 RepID=A0A6P5X5T5_DURZI|nr:F-box/kelch-repeat protein At3g06240-like [Durio zibethinus]
MAAGNLPGEIIWDILSRLPVKSLMRFRCVHKTWCYLFTTSSFVSAHLKNHNNEKQDLVFINQSNTGQEKLKALLLRDDTFDVYFDICMPFTRSCFASMNAVGSCDGLVCLYYDQHFIAGRKVLLYNPTTRQHKILPESPIPGPPNFREVSVTIGFGYDPIIDDCKVVRIVSWLLYNERLKAKSNQAQVYTLGTNSWKGKEILNSVEFDPCGNQAFVNGAIHWLVRVRVLDSWVRHYAIVRFNVSSDEIISFLLPRVVVHGKVLERRVDVFRSSLCVVNSLNRRQRQWFEIWTMDEDGGKKSWTKLHVIGPFVPYKKVIGFGMHEKLLLKGETGLTIFDISRKEGKHFAIDGTFGAFNAVAFMESLVSLRGGEKEAAADDDHDD